MEEIEQKKNISYVFRRITSGPRSLSVVHALGAGRHGIWGRAAIDGLEAGALVRAGARQQRAGRERLARTPAHAVGGGAAAVAAAHVVRVRGWNSSKEGW